MTNQTTNTEEAVEIEALKRILACDGSSEAYFANIILQNNTILFDSKGDADILKQMYAEAKRAGRENEVMRISCTTDSSDSTSNKDFDSN